MNLSDGELEESGFTTRLVNLVESTKSFLGFRREAYQHVFKAEGRYGAEVLKDLAKFCRANQSSFHPDPRMHAVLEGRREVWLRIQQHLQLDNDALYKLYGGKDV